MSQEITTVKGEEGPELSGNTSGELLKVGMLFSEKRIREVL
jgi:hypothetical protein